MPTSTTLPDATTPVYATDEDLLVRAGGDFGTLVPPWQAMAQGSDGVFAAGSPWVLASATVDFEANGVRPNHVVRLTAPAAAFPGGGDFLAVDAVAGGAITLRRPHQDTGAGQPPGTAAGLTGVKFLVATLDPQIEEASFGLKMRFGIDENISIRASDYLYDPRDLRMATVLAVLLGRYTQECRTDRGDFPRKIELIRAELADVLGRISLRWGASGAAVIPTSSAFGARVVR